MDSMEKGRGDYKFRFPWEALGHSERVMQMSEQDLESQVVNVWDLQTDIDEWAKNTKLKLNI